MNSIKTLLLFRTYTTKFRGESAGIRKKLEYIKNEKNPNVDLDNLDENDPEEYESDIINATETHTAHERKLERNKQLLAYRIVQSKYFKEVEPNFLTFIEKDQIRNLHADNPEVWTVEKLSKSFPALPETIKRVLKAKWNPKSVESIIKYDTKVIENWKNFKTDQLAVNPVLKEHLMKFRNRKIDLPDKEMLERFIPAPIELPKPQSKYFSSIITGNIDSEQHNQIEKSVYQKKNKSHLITDGKESVETRVEQSSDNNKLVPHKYKNNQMNERLVLTEFIKQKLNDLQDTSPEEKEVLLSTYRKQIESTNLEDVSSNISNNAAEPVPEEKDRSVSKKSSDEDALVVQKEMQSKVTTEINVEHTSLDTYVKERYSLMETDFEYTKRIKIPKNAYKKGMTYRIKDCYYDDDGEFLFRTPGLRA